MNNFKQTILYTIDDFTREERSRRTERRLLVIILCLSYIGCLATLWYSWNAPRQAFDAFWLSFGQTRFTLIILPLLLLGSSYFSLLCLFTPIYLIIQNMLTAAPLAANILGNAIIRSQTTTTLRMIISQPHSPSEVQTIFIARNALLNQGIYYCLFLLTVALIVWTLPRAIIAWKERG